MRFGIFQALFVIALFPSPVLSQPTPELSQRLNTPIKIERQTPVSSIPVTVRAGKLFLGATLSGQSGQFVFDTGSPTILTRDFAERIGVTYFGQNMGQDANGSPVIMDFATVETMTLGSTVFHDVPVLVSDFADAPLAKCLLEDGVIGSEIMAGSAWRIDLETGRVTIAATAEAAGVSSKALKTRLHDFGYPHMPIVDYRIGDLKDKALFDTGNADDLALYQPVFDSKDVKSAIRRGSMQTGQGFEGVSAGGLGKQARLHRFELSKVEVGGHQIRNLSGVSRSAAPTLVGAGFLDDFIVTLDFTDSRFLFEPRRVRAEKADPATGYSLMVVNGALTPLQIFDGSPMKAAGLRLGDRIIDIDGRETVANSDIEECSLLDWLLNDFDAETATEFTVERKGVLQRIIVTETP